MRRCHKVMQPQRQPNKQHGLVARQVVYAVEQGLSEHLAACTESAMALLQSHQLPPNRPLWQLSPAPCPCLLVLRPQCQPRW